MRDRYGRVDRRYPDTPQDAAARSSRMLSRAGSVNEAASSSIAAAAKGVQASKPISTLLTRMLASMPKTWNHLPVSSERKATPISCSLPDSRQIQL